MNRKLFAAIVAAILAVGFASNARADGGCSLIEHVLRTQGGINAQCAFNPGTQTYQINVISSAMDAAATLGAVVGAVLGADLKLNNARARWLEIYAASSYTGRVDFLNFKTCIVANGRSSPEVLGYCLAQSIR